MLDFFCLTAHEKLQKKNHKKNGNRHSDPIRINQRDIDGVNSKNNKYSTRIKNNGRVSGAKEH
jgi:hypothetical protein